MSQKNAAAKSSNVREFIYLDVPKIYSYLSQMEGGLRLLIEKVEDEYTDTELEPEIKETIIRATATAGADAKVPLLGGGNAEVGWERLRRTAPASERVVTRSGGGSANLSILHHKAFDLVFDRLKEKFTVATGDIYLLPLANAMEFVRMTKESRGESDEKFNRAQVGFEALKLISAETVVYCESADHQNLHGFMNEDHFTVTAEQFTSTYGVPSEGLFTLVGLKGQNVGKQHSKPIPHQAKDTEASNMFNALATFRNHVNKFLAQSGVRVYPLALYKTL